MINSLFWGCSDGGLLDGTMEDGWRDREEGTTSSLDFVDASALFPSQPRLGATRGHLTALLIFLRV